MATSDISIANLTNFEKIQNIFNDEKAYREILEGTENFNTRTNIERRLRMPFLDPQTGRFPQEKSKSKSPWTKNFSPKGVAQNHCSLFMKSGQRMPGFREGQIYTYPSKRWQKPKRQYLLHHQSYKAYQFREKTYLQHFSGEISGKCLGMIYWLFFHHHLDMLFSETGFLAYAFAFFVAYIRFCVEIDLEKPVTREISSWSWKYSFVLFVCSEHRLQWQQLAWD